MINRVVTMIDLLSALLSIVTTFCFLIYNLVILLNKIKPIKRKREEYLGCHSSGNSSHGVELAGEAGRGNLNNKIVGLRGAWRGQQWK